jgi:hypothetical protein
VCSGFLARTRAAEIDELETELSKFPPVGARYDAEQQAKVEY